MIRTTPVIDTGINGNEPEIRGTKKRRSTPRQATIQSFFSLETLGGRNKQAKRALLETLTPPTPLSSQTPETPYVSHSTMKHATPSKEADISIEPKGNGTIQQHNEIASQNQETNTAAPPLPVQTKSKNLQQMYLDLGQANFGKQTICQTCGMLYVHGLSEDSLQHERICQDYRQGIPFQLSHPRVVGKYGDDVVVEVRQSDSHASRQKVKRVQSIVEKDLGFNNISRNEQRTAYLYVRNKRVVGMAIAEALSKAFVLETSLQRSQTPTKAMVGIHQLWVHSNMRQEGIGTRLVDSVRVKFVFGLVVPADLVAFSSPTEAGARFAKTYIRANAGKQEGSAVLVYDCN